MSEQRLTLKKYERLTGEIRIKELFEKGSFFLSYPFRVGFLATAKTDAVPVRIMVVAPKKKFKKAPDRNRIKRLIREVYRKNKSDLYAVVDEKEYTLHLSLTYIATDILSYAVLEKKMKETLDKLKHQLP